MWIVLFVGVQNVVLLVFVLRARHSNSAVTPELYFDNESLDFEEMSNMFKEVAHAHDIDTTWSTSSLSSSDSDSEEETTEMPFGGISLFAPDPVT